MNRWMNGWMCIYIHERTPFNEVLRKLVATQKDGLEEVRKILPFVACWGCHAEVFDVVVCAMGTCGQSSRGRKLFDGADRTVGW